MSWMRYMTLYSFRKLNPNWKMVLSVCKSSKITHKTWNDSPKQDFFNYSGPDYFNKIEELDVEIVDWDFETEIGRHLSKKLGPSHMSNFFKWKLLSKKNEFYSDLDILYVRSMHGYYEKVKGFDTIICYNGHYFSIGFMASSGSNDFYRAVTENAKQNCTPKAYQSAGVNNIYNLFEKLENPNKSIMDFDLWSLLEKFYPKGNKYNNPMSLVYPWTCSKMAQVFGVTHKTIPDDCIGIHWYAGAKKSQECNNKLTEENYKDHSNTFCFFAKGLLNG